MNVLRFLPIHISILNNFDVEFYLFIMHMLCYRVILLEKSYNEMIIVKYLMAMILEYFMNNIYMLT